jgi:hypothetical protein
MQLLKQTSSYLNKKAKSMIKLFSTAWKVLPFLLLFVMQFLIPAVQSAIETDLTTRVSRVVDGDTFDTTSGDTIRLADINAPEHGESSYSIAKDFLNELVYGKNVYLDIDDVYQTDPFDRLVCVVYVSYNATHFKNVNKALLVAGVAEIKNYDNEFNPYVWTLYSPKRESPPQPPQPSPADTTPPRISILSPKNKTYTENSVPLTFTVNEATSWIGYYLDGQGSTITRNIFLSGLSNGSHSLIVSAKDKAGNLGSSDVVYFTINIQRQEPPLPSQEQPDSFLSPSELYVIIVTVIVIFGITGIILYRKRHPSTKPSS